MVHKCAEKCHEAEDKIHEVCTAVQKEVEGQVQKSPLQSVLMAFAAGTFLGLLLRRG